MTAAKKPLKWRRSFGLVDHYDLKFRTTGPSYHMGSADMYKTGALVEPLTDYTRKNEHYGEPRRLALPDEKYIVQVCFKRGNMKAEAMASGFSRTVDEGKAACESYLRSKGVEIDDGSSKKGTA